MLLLHSSQAKQYKRYKLSDRKTFDSLFFPEKDGMLHLFDNFLKKKEKVRGSARKSCSHEALVFLLIPSIGAVCHPWIP